MHELFKIYTGNNKNYPFKVYKYFKRGKRFIDTVKKDEIESQIEKQKKELEKQQQERELAGQIQQ